MTPQQFVINFHLLIIISFKTIHMARAYLLFPNNTVLQLTASISVPIADLPKNRKVLWDWGIQMNYMMPFDPESFYNAPIWATNVRNAENFRWSRSVNQIPAKCWESFESNKTITRKSHDVLGNRHNFDFTAGEFYKALERLIESHDYHSSCLLQSVCDVAKHPFDLKQQHLITNLITFILTPSWHLGFDASEEEQRRAFESAEKSGILGMNCKEMYPNCPTNLLEMITHVIYDE